MARSNIGRAIQIGKETTQGVAVPANKRFASLNIDLNFEGKTKQYRAQGFKFNTTSSLQRAWQKGSYDGPITFTELIYPLSSLYGTPVPTTPVGGTTARRWSFLPPTTGQNLIQTYTLEEGDATAATQSPGVAFTSISLDFGADDISMKGSMIGPLGTTTTLTAAPTVLQQIVGQAIGVDMYISTTYTNEAALFVDANKLTDAYGASFDTGDSLDPRFVLNTAYPAYKDLVEKPADLKFSFMTEYNAQARALYTSALQNAFRYVGVRVLGPVIEGTIYNSIELVVACSITPNKREDAGGVWGYSYNATPVVDNTLGSAFKINVVNNVAAL